MNGKKKFLWKPLVLALLVFIAFDALVFLLPFRRENSFWVGYGFTAVSFLIALTATFLSLGGRRPMKSKYLGLSVFVIAWRYVAVQAAWGLVCMLAPDMPLWVSGLVGLLILCGGLFLIFSVEIGADEVRSVGAEIERKRDYVQLLYTDVSLLPQRTGDPALKQQLEELARQFRFSDPMSSEELASLESEIAARVAQLKEALPTQPAEQSRAQAAELSLLLAERNAKCKVLK